jgi:hypothetical protein
MRPSTSDRMNRPRGLWTFAPRRRRLLATIALFGMALLQEGPSAALADDAPALSDAVAVLEKERSAAEQYAVILATVGRKDANLYVRGIQLYADAKAEFDGLIAALRIDLIEGRTPHSRKSSLQPCKAPPRSASPSPTSSATRWSARPRVRSRAWWTW